MPVYTERGRGTYRCTYLGCEDRTVEDKETAEEKVLWLWRFQELADPTSAGEISKWTGTSLRSPNSNAYRLAAGILDHKPDVGDDTEVMRGRIYDVVYDRNQAGNLTILTVQLVDAPQAASRPQAAPQPAAAPVPAPAPVGAAVAPPPGPTSPTDDDLDPLPF